MFRVSRKLVLLSGGFLLFLGVSGTAALVFAPAHMIPGYGDTIGGHCKTVYQSDFRRGEETRLIAVISTDDTEPAARVRTGVRVARHLSETLNPDLVIVQVSDYRGPTARADLRGSALGAEIVYAPRPSRSLAVSKPWEVRYVDSAPTATGHYFGERVDMPMLMIEAINREIDLVEGCHGEMIDGVLTSVAVDEDEMAAESADLGGH
ncbi:hypothetical protein PZ897_13660 [Hoeflea sp. YIM 152468]|nr:hypothetical protein [Hoeflea sp. YIM 152468]